MAAVNNNCKTIKNAMIQSVKDIDFFFNISFANEHSSWQSITEISLYITTK